MLAKGANALWHPKSLHTKSKPVCQHAENHCRAAGLLSGWGKVPPVHWGGCLQCCCHAEICCHPCIEVAVCGAACQADISCHRCLNSADCHAVVRLKQICYKMQGGGCCQTVRCNKVVPLLCALPPCGLPEVGVPAQGSRGVTPTTVVLEPTT